MRQIYYCYLIQCGLTGHLKVGITNDITARLSSIQSCTPGQLTLLVTAGSDQRPAVVTLETRMLSRFDGCRLRRHTEWLDRGAKTKALEVFYALARELDLIVEPKEAQARPASPGPSQNPVQKNRQLRAMFGPSDLGLE